MCELEINGKKYSIEENSSVVDVIREHLKNSNIDLTNLSSADNSDVNKFLHDLRNQSVNNKMSIDDLSNLLDKSNSKETKASKLLLDKIKLLANKMGVDLSTITVAISTVPIAKSSTLTNKFSSASYKGSDNTIVADKDTNISTTVIHELLHAVSRQALNIPEYRDRLDKLVTAYEASNLDNRNRTILNKVKEVYSNRLSYLDEVLVRVLNGELQDSTILVDDKLGSFLDHIADFFRSIMKALGINITDKQNILMTEALKLNLLSTNLQDDIETSEPIQEEATDLVDESMLETIYNIFLDNYNSYLTMMNKDTVDSIPMASFGKFINRYFSGSDLDTILGTEYIDNRPINEVLEEFISSDVSASILFDDTDTTTYKELLTKLFPAAEFRGKINRMQLGTDILTFRDSDSSKVRISALRNIISQLWYNVLTDADKKAIRATINDIPSNIFELPKFVNTSKGTLAVIPDAIEINDNITYIKLLDEDGKEVSYSVTDSNVVKILQVDNKGVRYKYVKPDTVEDIIHLANIYKLSLGKHHNVDTDFDAIQALTQVYAYSNKSDIDARVDKFIEEVANENSEIIQSKSITSTTDLLNKLVTGGFVAKDLSQFDLNLSTLFGDYINGSYVNGHNNIRMFNFMIDSIMYSLLTGKDSVLFKALSESEKASIIASDAEIESKLIQVIKLLSTKGNIVNGKLYPNEVAKYAAKLLKPMADSSPIEGIKESKLNYLYRLKNSTELEEAVTGVESLGDTNDNMDHAKLSGKLVRKFLTYIPRKGSKSFYDYNFMFVNAIKLLTDPHLIGKLNDITELDKALSKIVTQYKDSGKGRLAEELLELLDNISNGKSKYNVNIKEDDNNVYFLYSRSNINLETYTIKEHELDPKDVVVLKDTSLDGLWAQLSSLNLLPSDFNKNEYLLLYKRAKAIEILRGLQSYVGSLTEKDYSYYDFSRGAYVPFSRKGIQQSVGEVFTNTLFEPNISYKKDKGTKLKDNKGKFKFKPHYVYNNLSSLFQNMGLRNISSVLSEASFNTKEAYDAYSYIVNQVNKVAKKFEDIEVTPSSIISYNNEIDKLDFKDKLKSIEALLDLIQENYTNVSVTSPDENKIYRYTMGSYFTNKMSKRLPSNSNNKLTSTVFNGTKSYIDNYTFYTGSKLGPRVKSYWRETIADFQKRDVAAFEKGYAEAKAGKTKYFSYSLNSQGDKAKGLVFRTKLLVGKELDNLLSKLLEDYYNNYAYRIANNLKVNDIATSIPYKVGNTIKYENIKDYYNNGKADIEGFKELISKYVDSYFDSEVKSRDSKTKDAQGLLVDFVINNMIYGFAINDEIAGNLFDFKNDEDLIKRLTGSLAPGTQLYTGIQGANKQFGVVQLIDKLAETDELFKESTNLKQQFSKLQDIIQTYYKNKGESYELTDGQGFITERRYYELSNGLPYSYDVKQIIKPVIFDGNSYHKYSAFVFTKDLARFIGAEELYEAVNSLEDKFREANPNLTLEFLFESTTKKGKNLVKSISIDDLKANKIPDNYYKLIDTNNYRLQLNPNAGKNKTSFPIQPAYFLAQYTEEYLNVTNAWKELIELGIENLNKKLPITKNRYNKTVITPEQAAKRVEIEQKIAELDEEKDEATIQELTEQLNKLKYFEVQVEKLAETEHNQKAIANFIKYRLEGENTKVGDLIDAGLPLSHSLIYKPSIETFLSSTFRSVYKHTEIKDSGQLVLANSSLFKDSYRPRYFLKDSDALEKARTLVNKEIGSIFKGVPLTEEDLKTLETIIDDRVEEVKKEHKNEKELVATVVVPAKFLTEQQKKDIVFLNSYKKAVNLIKELRNKKSLTDKEVTEINKAIKFANDTSSRYENTEYPSLIGFRTPSTGLHSMVNIRVERFHNEDAKIIYVPEGLSILSGADKHQCRLKITLIA